MYRSFSTVFGASLTKQISATSMRKLKTGRSLNGEGALTSKRRIPGGEGGGTLLLSGNETSQCSLKFRNPAFSFRLLSRFVQNEISVAHR